MEGMCIEVTKNNMIGNKFGRLMVLSQEGKDKHGKYYINANVNVVTQQ